MIGVLDERAGERGVALAAAALGVALAGPFETLVRHQMLGWHQSAAAWPGLLLYIVQLAALFALWRRRALLTRMPGRRLAGAVLIGFGGFMLVDTLVFDWVFGWHSAATGPGMHELVWLGLCGLAPLLLGRRLVQPGRGPARRGREAWRHAPFG